MDSEQAGSIAAAECTRTVGKAETILCQGPWRLLDAPTALCHQAELASSVSSAQWPGIVKRRAGRMRPARDSASMAAAFDWSDLVGWPTSFKPAHFAYFADCLVF